MGIVTLNSQFPGFQLIADSMFGSNILDEVLVKTFFIDEKAVQQLKRSNAQTSSSPHVVEDETIGLGPDIAKTFSRGTSATALIGHLEDKISVYKPDMMALKSKFNGKFCKRLTNYWQSSFNAGTQSHTIDIFNVKYLITRNSRLLVTALDKPLRKLK
ncbi:hypothetical protein SELMODRAFT_423673 [Selaginella moellendorffii]|uniref:Uncharacterized protein n=1 Tax=Selaginella moellendorffii TaxID=88036 RepID=D8SMG9_SELML|nr:hypothetical protein SELMODRAFT_423673 [Selaginella moellendorffii]